MHPLNNGSQVENIPATKSRVGIAGYFSESNDNGAPSYPGQDWFNAVIRELQTALYARKVPFNPDKFDHLKLLIEGAGDPTGVNSLQYRVGHRIEIHSATIPDWLLKADGSIVSRTVDDVLWEHAENSGLLISQTLKDGDPVKYAMYYGDGDNSTTFSLPNWYLGHFARGNPAGVHLGQTQEDTMRNLTGSIIPMARTLSDGHSPVRNGNGVLQPLNTSVQAAGVASISTVTSSSGISIDASRQVPTSDEFRGKSGNINICIERGKIPV